MAAYEANIIEIAAKKLHEKGEGLQSLVLHYEKADFLEWLRNNITLDEVIQTLFKHTCLANGVKLTIYNQYFSDNNPEILHYVLEEESLRNIMMVFIIGQSPKDSCVYQALQEKFNFGAKETNEIISIVGSILNTKYEPRSIAAKEYVHFLKKTENHFLETRNALCYNIAQKKMDCLESELTGSILDDLKCGLKIIISLIETIHYALLPTPWNETISFAREDGTLQKNILPSTLYSYYSTLKNLLALANKSQDPPIQYKDIFTDKIAPFFEIFQKEENSFFAENLRYHYKWHVLGLDFLCHLPKQILKAEASRPKHTQEETQSPTEPFASPPSSAESVPEIMTKPTSLQALEMYPIQSKSIGNSRNSASEEADGKEKMPSTSAIPDQASAGNSSSSHFRNQRTSVHSSTSSTTHMPVNQLSIFADEKNVSNKQMHAILLEAIIQRIHSKPEPDDQPGIRWSLFHPRYPSKPHEPSSESLRDEDSLFRTWLFRTRLLSTRLLSTTTYTTSRVIMYDDFNAVLGERISKSLPRHIDLSDFQDFNMPIFYYFLEDSMHSLIAVYAVTNDLLTRKHSMLYSAEKCISSFCASFNLDIDIFSDYEHLSHLLTKELKTVSSSSDSEESFVITRPIPKESAQLTEEEMEKFSACERVARSINEKKAIREKLDIDICEFCKANAINVIDLMNYAKESFENVSAEAGSFHHYIQLAKVVLGLDEEIRKYDEAIKAAKTLQYINKYELMIQHIMQRGKSFMNYREATRIIALYGHGLINPYLFQITFEKYQELVEKEENSFSQIKHEVYYGVAEKELAERKRASSTLSLVDIKLHMEYIVTVIELAPYDGNFSYFEKITYTFNGQLQEKCIPSALYRYYEELKKMIEKATIAHDQASYLQELNTKIVIFQAELKDESIHYMWHHKFLTHLYIMTTALLEKSIDKLLSQSGEPSPSQKPSSGNSSSFQYEDQRRSRIQSGSLDSHGADPQSTSGSAKWNTMSR